MADYYTDSAAGNDGNAGTSAAAAKQTLAAGLSLLSAAGDVLWVKASAPYVLTSTATITASVKGDTTGGRIRVEGYTTTPGARDGRPTITSATNSVALITLNDNDYFEFAHLRLTHTAGTRGIAFNFQTSASSPVFFTDCRSDGCLQFHQGSSLNVSTTLTDCAVENCTSTTSAILAGNELNIYGSVIRGSSGDGVRVGATTNSTVNIHDSLIYSNAGYGINDATGASVNLRLNLHGNVIWSNGNSGVRCATHASSGVTCQLVNNIIGANAGYNLEIQDTQIETDTFTRLNRRNFHYASTSGFYSGITAGFGDVTLTVDPFTNAAAGDFSLNNTASGGAAVRAAAFPGAFPDGLTTSYRDGGAAQHQDAGGGGGASGGFVIGG